VALDRVRAQADELDAALGEFRLELRKGAELGRAAETFVSIPTVPLRCVDGDTDTGV